MMSKNESGKARDYITSDEFIQSEKNYEQNIIAMREQSELKIDMVNQKLESIPNTIKAIVFEELNNKKQSTSWLTSFCLLVITMSIVGSFFVLLVMAIYTIM